MSNRNVNQHKDWSELRERMRGTAIGFGSSRPDSIRSTADVRARGTVAPPSSPTSTAPVWSPTREMRPQDNYRNLRDNSRQSGVGFRPTHTSHDELRDRMRGSAIGFGSSRPDFIRSTADVRARGTVAPPPSPSSTAPLWSTRETRQHDDYRNLRTNSRQSEVGFRPTHTSHDGLRERMRGSAIGFGSSRPHYIRSTADVRARGSVAPPSSPTSTAPLWSSTGETRQYDDYSDLRNNLRQSGIGLRPTHESHDGLRERMRGSAIGFGSSRPDYIRSTADVRARGTVAPPSSPTSQPLWSSYRSDPYSGRMANESHSQPQHGYINYPQYSPAMNQSQSHSRLYPQQYQVSRFDSQQPRNPRPWVERRRSRVEKQQFGHYPMHNPRH